MATWSITPDTGLASIDNTGKLTYQEHTEDTVYTISYVGDDGCTASKEITIKKCEGPEPPTSGDIMVVVYHDSYDEGGKIIELSLKYSESMLHLTGVTGTLLPDSTSDWIIECDVSILHFSVTPAIPADANIQPNVSIKVGTESNNHWLSYKKLYDRVETNASTGCEHRVLGLKAVNENHCMTYDPDVRLICY